MESTKEQRARRRTGIARCIGLRGCGIALVGGFVLLSSNASARPARADNPVTNLNDSGPGSLRQAIADALPGETITFAVTGLINLTSGELVIGKDLTISGPGRALLGISAGGGSRVLRVAAGVTATVEDLTLRDGRLLSGSGAGILNRGTLMLYDAAVMANAIHSFGSTGGGGIANEGSLVAANTDVTDNDAHLVLEGGGGIHNTGALDLTSCDVADNEAENGDGGGIWNAGIATLAACTVSGNTGLDGGGIWSQGALSIADSSVVANAASNHGGGLRTEGTATIARSLFAWNAATVWGGGILNWNSSGDSELIVASSTLSQNTADLGGALSNFDEATLSKCTITGNLLAIENLGPLAFKDCIVAGNTGLDCIEPPTAVAGTNYDSDGTCTGFTTVIAAELALAPLADNGGPTLTHALPPGSIALDHAPDANDFFGNPLATDQRGVPIPQGPLCDVGAYELERDGRPRVAPGPGGVR